MRINISKTRRDFLKTLAGSGALMATGLPSMAKAKSALPEGKWFRISLAQWSLHRSFRSGERDAMDFAKISRELFGIRAIEYVNQFYRENFSDKLVADLKKRADGEGVDSLLIMCDGLGRIGDPDDAARQQTVDNHKPWADAAKELGCHSIRVNAGSTGTFEEQQKLAADGLRKLSEYGDSIGINVIVENHGGLSSNGAWLAGVMKMVDHPRCGTLPDFGNFWINKKTKEYYDRYMGMEELLPFAKGVSAKSYNFDAEGNETIIDYPRILNLVKASGYLGYIGIEYEGREIGAVEGIKATQTLLERLGGVT